MGGCILHLHGYGAVVGIVLDEIVGVLLFLETADTASSLPVVIGSELLEGNLAVIDVVRNGTLGVERTHDTADTAHLHTVGGDVSLVGAVSYNACGIDGTGNTGDHHIGAAGLHNALVKGNGTKVGTTVDNGSIVQASYDTAVHDILAIGLGELEVCVVGTVLDNRFSIVAMTGNTACIGAVNHSTGPFDSGVILAAAYLSGRTDVADEAADTCNCTVVEYQGDSGELLDVLKGSAELGADTAHMAGSSVLSIADVGGAVPLGAVLGTKDDVLDGSGNAQEKTGVPLRSDNLEVVDLVVLAVKYTCERRDRCDGGAAAVDVCLNAPLVIRSVVLGLGEECVEFFKVLDGVADRLGFHALLCSLGNEQLGRCLGILAGDGNLAVTGIAFVLGNDYGKGCASVTGGGGNGNPTGGSSGVPLAIGGQGHALGVTLCRSGNRFLAEFHAGGNFDGLLLTGSDCKHCQGCHNQ